jgi:hypothetical protein
MGYVIAAVVLLLIVAAGVTFFVLNASSRQRQAAAADSGHGEGTPGSEAAIVAPDERTPLGDTDQHAGEQTEQGRTVSGREGEGRGPARGSVPPAGEGGVGGEGESGGPTGPESERLANRPR